MQNRRNVVLGACTLLFGNQRKSNAAKSLNSDESTAWVARALTRMETIQPGMTRKEILSVFTIEGGVSTPFERTYVSQDCPYFKVDVQFTLPSPPEPDRKGKPEENAQDRIRSISRPYLAFSTLD